MCSWGGSKSVPLDRQMQAAIRRARERPALRLPRGAPTPGLLRRQTNVVVRCSASMRGPAVCV